MTNHNNDDDDTILQSEVEKAIQSLRGGKSTRLDNIQAKMLKAGGDHITTVQAMICNRIWHTKMWLEQWTKSTVTTIPKKGNVQVSKNYRTISLISHPSKVMFKILLNRLQPKASLYLQGIKQDLEQAEEQCN